MKKQILTKGLIGLVVFGSSALISCTNSKNSNPIKTNSDTATVVNIKSASAPSYSDTTMVIHIGNDTDFAFLLSGTSQPYMTIGININGEIMTYWGDLEHRRTYIELSIDELKQIILDRFGFGDKPKENELFHVNFDRSTPISKISALKDMLLEIGVNRCEVRKIYDYRNGLIPPPPAGITEAEIIEITTNGVPSNSEEADAEQSFLQVEQKPEFPGGMVALMKYIHENIKYPTDCKKEGIQGRVIVQFVVNKDGSISEANVIKPVNPQLDAEALRVVYTMPNWIPGKQKGKCVRVRFTLPIIFRLSE